MVGILRQLLGANFILAGFVRIRTYVRIFRSRRSGYGETNVNDGVQPPNGGAFSGCV